MALFSYDENGRIGIIESDRCAFEGTLIEKLSTLLEVHGCDMDASTTGVFESPDLGYFALADRFWRASLCIYFAGFCKAFMEAGAGFLEPWIFNVRHSIELYLKGCILFTEWYNELREDIGTSGRKTMVDKIENKHGLMDLYDIYRREITEVVGNWPLDEDYTPEMEKLVLSEYGEKILQEISDADSSGFRFRYPSLMEKTPDGNKSHKLQEFAMTWDDKQLFPITNLPKKSGVGFRHVKMMNAFHDLFIEMKNIENYHDAIYTYIDELQSYMRNY